MDEFRSVMTTAVEAAMDIYMGRDGSKVAG